MRLQSEQESQAREQAKQRAFEDRQRREQEWAAAETARLDAPEAQNQIRWLMQLQSLIEQHAHSGPPVGTADQMVEIDAVTDRYLMTIRTVLELYRKPFPPFVP